MVAPTYLKIYNYAEQIRKNVHLLLFTLSSLDCFLFVCFFKVLGFRNEVCDSVFKLCALGFISLNLTGERFYSTGGLGVGHAVLAFNSLGFVMIPRESDLFHCLHV